MYIIYRVEIILHNEMTVSRIHIQNLDFPYIIHENKHQNNRTNRTHLVEGILFGVVY